MVASIAVAVLFASLMLWGSRFAWVVVLPTALMALFGPLAPESLLVEFLSWREKVDLRS
jgi:hypothetical protein